MAGEFGYRYQDMISLMYSVSVTTSQCLVNKMIKILQTYQKTLSHIIVHDTALDNSRMQKYTNALKQTLAISSLGLGLVFMTLFVIFEAETVQDFSDSFYAMSTIAVNVPIVAIYVWRKKKVFELIDRLEDAIATRK